MNRNEFLKSLLPIGAGVAGLSKLLPNIEQEEKSGTLAIPMHGEDNCYFMEMGPVSCKVDSKHGSFKVKVDGVDFWIPLYSE